MGNGQSAFSYFSNKMKTDKGQQCFKRLNEIGEEDLHSPHFGKSGLAFYAPLNEDDLSGDEKRKHGFGNKPKLSSEKHGDLSFTDSLKSKEREMLADVIVEQHLQEKTRKARQADEKRQLVLDRREKKEEEVRNKYESKMKKMEERRQEVQNRLRPPNSQVRSFHTNEDKKVNLQKLDVLEL